MYGQYVNNQTSHIYERSFVNANTLPDPTLFYERSFVYTCTQSPCKGVLRTRVRKYPSPTTQIQNFTNARS